MFSDKGGCVCISTARDIIVQYTVLYIHMLFFQCKLSP